MTSADAPDASISRAATAAAEIAAKRCISLRSYPPRCGRMPLAGWDDWRAMVSERSPDVAAETARVLGVRTQAGAGVVV
jgi:hypothetical protein